MLETKRCIIKPISSDDKQGLFSMCDDVDIWNYLGGSNTANFHRTNIENLEKHLPDPNRWIIRDKKTIPFWVICLWVLIMMVKIRSYHICCFQNIGEMVTHRK